MSCVGTVNVWKKEYINLLIINHYPVSPHKKGEISFCPFDLIYCISPQLYSLNLITKPVQKITMEEFSISKVASKFNKLQKTVIALVVENATDWGILPLVVTNIVGNQTTYTPLYSLSTGKTTKSVGNTTNRDDYMTKTFSPALESLFIKYLINNTAISAADKLAMGIHEPNTDSTPIPDPITSPIMKIAGNGEDLVLLVEMRNAATNRLGKPAGVGFCEIWYRVDLPEPVAVADTDLKINIHKSGTTMTFLGAQQGKKMYYFARWVTTKGFYGPWTKLLNVTIP